MNRIRYNHGVVVALAVWMLVGLLASANATIEFGVSVQSLTPSPDGKSLAFVKVVSGVGFTVWRMRLDGTGFQQVGKDDFGCDVFPKWSADSKTVAVLRSMPAGSHVTPATGKHPPLAYNQSGLWVASNSGSRIRLPVKGDITEAVWSSDGKRVFYVSEWGRRTLNDDYVYYGDVFVVNADGSGARQLTHFAPPLFRSTKRDIVALDVLSDWQTVLAAALLIATILGCFLARRYKHPRQHAHNHRQLRPDCGDYGDQEVDWEVGG